MQTDVLIIGCGIAGASAALELSRDRERHIICITREARAKSSSSSWAQGGIVGRGLTDTPELLTEDVLRAGDGLCLPEAVHVLADEGPRLLQETLVERLGLRFDHGAAGEPIFGLEGAHSTRRILHVRDQTGRALMEALLHELGERPNVTLLTAHTAIDLLTFPHHSRELLAVYRPPTCHGAYVFDQTSSKVVPVLALRTILATGGLGQIFLNTTNPPGARGDGLALAYRAGARVINNEYVQFHPTALHMPGTTKALISEAVRGEGGVLITPSGEAFMERHAPLERDLASRDRVSRAIYEEMLLGDLPYVFLDIASRRSADYIRERFPAIHARCLEHEIDITRQPIPVVPAAHYFCGGVLADLWGRTTLPGLYAVGEVACTGVHGANRLASTSLLEGLVWGVRAAQDVRREEPRSAVSESEVPPWDDSRLTYQADPALIQVDLQTIRNLMWHYVGLVRSEGRLLRAVDELRRMARNIEDFYRRAFLSDSLIGLRNAALSSLIVARAALRNPVSRGCHFRTDSHPADRAQPPDAKHHRASRA